MKTRLIYPKGKIPPQTARALVRRYQGIGLTNLGIGLNFEGFWIVVFLYPARPPKKTNGIETPNHNPTNSNAVKKRNYQIGVSGIKI